jgi:hypothetical protein
VRKGVCLSKVLEGRSKEGVEKERREMWYMNHDH